jgi:hypothetical protein
LTRHLNFPYIRKNKHGLYPLDKISKQDKYFLQTFNFYNKKIDFSKFEDSDDINKIFKIEKTAKSQSTDPSVLCSKEDINEKLSLPVNINYGNDNGNLLDNDNLNHLMDISYINYMIQLLSYNNNVMNSLLGTNYVALYKLIQLVNLFNDGSH